MLISIFDRLISLFPESLKNKLRYSRLNFLWILYFNLREKFFGGPFYGQLEEDKYILKYFPEANGTYVDVGAGHPIRGSNSFYFYEKGWRGLTIDPIKKNVVLHRVLRRHDSQLQSLIGVSNEREYFYHFEPYEYSTSDDSIALETLSKPGVRLLAKEKLKITRLSSLNLVSKPVEPSFLSIDVEGKDFEVLKSINWNDFLPRLICVESWSDNNLETSKIQNYLEKKGYEFQQSVGLSHIFVHTSYLRKVSTS